MFKLTNKTAIVTGGGSGIGAAISLVFARQGAKVFIFDVDPEGGNQTVAQIQQEGGSAYFNAVDVTRLDQVKQAIQAVMNTTGRLDILVNNAAIAHIGNAETTTPEDMANLLQVNVQGVYHLIHAAVPHMKEKGGVVLNMASIAASVGIDDRFAYSTTKGAIKTMTLSVAKDYLPYHIRCNCISPARVHTPFVDGFLKKNYPGREEEMFDKLSKTQPIGRMAKPEEVAAMALYLCSDEASFLTGCDYLIDGGFIALNG
ncbi:MAG TPA: SDR family oxidoreductase [Saprospiraceae bacterium]|nr:SDR family oxidoreductase [Saprospiraceae bacterium]